MRKQSIVIIVLLALAINVYASEKIKIAYFDDPPHINYSNNQHVGALVDFWEKHLAPKMQVEIEWVGPLPPVRLLKKLENGKVNCIALLAKNPKRAKIYDYPENPFTSMKAGVCVLRERKMTQIESIEDLRDLQLCFFKDGFIPPAMKNTNIEWDLLFAAEWRDHCLMKVLARRVDGAFEPDRSAFDYYFAKEPKYREKMIVLDIPETRSSLYSLFSKADNGKFLKLYNKAHRILLQNNKDIYKKLLKSMLYRSF